MRVLIVDDHPLFRDGLAALLESLADLEVAGLVADGREASTSCGRRRRRRPDGPQPAVLSGVDATAPIAALPAPPEVLVLTMVDDDDTVVAALRAGARGYVLKGASAEEVAAAIPTVAAGGAVFGAGVAAHVLALTATPRPSDAPTRAG